MTHKWKLVGRGYTYDRLTCTTCGRTVERGHVKGNHYERVIKKGNKLMRRNKRR